MAIYDQFASIYQRGPYLRFSQELAQSIIPEYLEELGIKPTRLLDIACGEGTFAVAMKKLGYTVTGIDQSSAMIALAKERAKEEGVAVNFIVEDMKTMSFIDEFDLVTCFFDSLNYLVTINDLQQAFAGAYQALKPGGIYIFDMNTVYGLAVDWMRHQTYIQNETQDFIELHRQYFDYENLIATIAITVFAKAGDSWQRFDEDHQERGYPIADIHFLLEKTGFQILSTYGNLKKRSELMTSSPRVWITARKSVDFD
jgi:ubiquinone/menaquinone biosynthesis C-methylase UbiE